MPVVYLKKVQLEQLDQVIEIIEEAKTVLKQRDINLWQDGYPDRDVLVSDIKRGIAYFLIKDDDIAGVAAIEDQGEKFYEELIEGDWSSKSQPHYAIIHRVAISQRHQGEGLASVFIQHLLSIAASKGLTDIRIDTHVDNVPMQHVILKNGFIQCGKLFNASHTPCVAFQRFI